MHKSMSGQEVLSPDSDPLHRLLQHTGCTPSLRAEGYTGQSSPEK